MPVKAKNKRQFETVKSDNNNRLESLINFHSQTKISN